MSDQEKLLTLVLKLQTHTWKKSRQEKSLRSRTNTLEDLKKLLRGKATEDLLERYLANQKREVTGKINVLKVSGKKDAKESPSRSNFGRSGWWTPNDPS